MADERVAPFLDSVTVLKASNGSVVYLVGTEIFSKESQEDVAEVINAVKPNTVVMDMCKIRMGMLSNNSCVSNVSHMTLGSLMRSIKKIGLVEAMINEFLINTTANLSRDFGMVPGGEYRRALDEAKKYGSCVFLGDRPFVITIKRIISMLSWFKSIRLLANLLFFKVFKITKKDMEKFKKNDLLQTLMLEMALDCPELKKVMVDEKDQCLTYCLQHFAGIMIDQPGSKPKSKFPKRKIVVGVVGLAHVAGIKKYWQTVSKQQSSELAIIPPPSRSNRIINTTFKVSMYGLLLYSVTCVIRGTGNPVVKSLLKNAYSAITRV